MQSMCATRIGGILMGPIQKAMDDASRSRRRNDSLMGAEELATTDEIEAALWPRGYILPDRWSMYEHDCVSFSRHLVSDRWPNLSTIADSTIDIKGSIAGLIMCRASILHSTPRQYIAALTWS
jgi:hypothetical protein